MPNSTSEPTEQEVKTHDWHPLPQLIGNAVTGNIEEIATCGKWAVEVDDGEVVIYTTVDEAADEEDLPEADVTKQIWDAYIVLDVHAEIPEPEFGWDSETSAIEETIWGGYR